MTNIPRDDPTTRMVLRHLLATIAYRAGKAVRGTPEAFGQFRPTPDSRSPAEILAHMGDLMAWVRQLLDGEWRYTPTAPLPWDQEIARFYSTLEALDSRLATGAPIQWEPERILQGGIADALTHTGQLAMLRRLSGRRMRGESYAKADIVIGRVGPDQTPPDPANERD